MTRDEGRAFFANRGNVRNSLEQYHWGGREPPAARAYEEAFDWLIRRGLVSREPSQSSPDWFFVTDAGWQLIESGGDLAELEAAERLAVDLHPAIAERVRAQYLLREFETAAFLALREVEIRVRKLAGASESDIGVRLMQSAFGEDGPLADLALDPGERQARMALFWGAIGVFKNPSSHRQVDIEDPTLASEVILLADLLLRLLDAQSL